MDMVVLVIGIVMFIPVLLITSTIRRKLGMPEMSNNAGLLLMFLYFAVLGAIVSAID